MAGYRSLSGSIIVAICIAFPSLASLGSPSAVLSVKTFPLALSREISLPAGDSASENGCVDLTGTWKGSCKDSQGQQSEESRVIAQQGCGFVTLDGSLYTLGGLQTLTESDPAVAYTITNDVAWDLKKTVITVKSHSTGKGLIEKPQYNFFSEYLETYKLVDGKLQTDISGQSTLVMSGTPQVMKTSYTCTYEKRD
jgi:hypothetical protein